MRVDSGDVGCTVHAEPGEQLRDCDRDQVVALVRDHGYVFFSGFEPSLEDFESFTSQFGTCAGTRGVHYPPGGEALGFHAEDAYNPYRPDTLWFLCLFEGSDGGAPTGVVDGVQLLADLPDEWREFAYANTLRFDRHWAADLWQRNVGGDDPSELSALLSGIPNLTHSFLPDGTLYMKYEVPIVTRTPAGIDSFSNTLLQATTEQEFYGMSLGDGSPVPDEFVSMVEKWCLDHELLIGWKAGEVGVINNLRMMHRRGEYHGKDRDLRARHCEDFFGTALPADDTPLSAWVKRLMQSDEGYPIRVGPLPEAEPAG